MPKPKYDPDIFGALAADRDRHCGLLTGFTQLSVDQMRLRSW
jgi:hypothetical protein